MTAVLVPGLLHEDALVRTAAASLAFNAAAVLQKGRVDAVRNSKDIGGGDDDWEVEMVSAVIEAIDREKESEEVGEYQFRQTFLWRLILSYSPSFDGFVGIFASFITLLRVTVALSSGGPPEQKCVEE